MPKLRRLNGKEVIAIFRHFGFEVVRVRGSHTNLQRIVDGQHQNLNIPLHGSKPIPVGTPKSIMRQESLYLTPKEIDTEFYSS
ncbi:MAG: type II toxin-antitoxin system HicA family toxin [Chloroflexota bacterium]